MKLKAPTVALEVRELTTDKLIHRVELPMGANARYIERCLGGLLINMDKSKYYVLEATK